MAISGSQKAVTPARSGLARSGATRSAWPLTIGRRVPLYALSNIARSDATRSNYHGPAGFITLGGTQIGTTPGVPGQKVVGNIVITDALNETPNRCQFRVRGVVPKVGQDVIVTVGSKNTLDRLFAGQVLNFTHAYVGSPANYVFDVNAIDWTWGLRQRLVSKRWTNTSATTIGQELVALGAPGYTTDYVAANLPALDEFTVTDQDVPTALTALAQRIGGYWYVDYHKRIHLFTTDDPMDLTDPAVLNPIHATLTDLTIGTDGSQLVTRLYVEGAGAAAAGDVPPGETLLPVVTAAWYEAGGGVVKAGPQRLTYTGRYTGGGGSLVGPGASPSGAVTAQVIGGSGIDAGAHDYAITFVTASGESVIGPRTSVTVGAIAAPTTAPKAGNIGAGPGPDPGYHYWAVTFVTATGETPIGPGMVTTIPAGVDVVAAPTPTTPALGGSIEPGSFSYAVTYGTASGESTIGPQSGLVTLTSVSVAPVPTVPPTPGTPTTGGNMENNTFHYLATNETTSGESTQGPTSAAVAMIHAPIPPATAGPTPGTPAFNVNAYITNGTYEYLVTFVDSRGYDTGYRSGDPISAPVVVNIAQNGFAFVPLTNLPIGGAGTVKRRIYRRRTTPNPQASFFKVFDVNDNTTTTTTDGTADASMGEAPQATNATIGGGWTTAIPVTVPVGPAGVTKRHLYRTVANSSIWQRVTTLTNNTTTAYTDITATSALAGQPGLPAGTTQNSIPVVNIPIGPAGVTKRHLYRSNGAGNRKVTTINNNTATTYTDTTATASLGAAPPTVNTSAAAQLTLTDLPIGGPDVTGRRIYRTPKDNQDPAAFRLVLTVPDNTTRTTVDTVTDANLGVSPPATSTALANRVALSAVPVGASAVTARRIYRTAANSATLKLVTSINDNTTTTYTDAAADATLGVSPPGVDTSQLPQPSGNVNAGATTLIVATTAGFRTAGGWAVIGNGQQVIRYTGLTANALTGIPAAGPGAIVAAISYNSTVTAAALLTGIPTSGTGAIVYPITKGDPVNLWIQVDDLAAQAVVAALFTTAAGGSHSGIIEDVIQDRRLSATEARARGRAHLTQRRDVQLTVKYKSRDMNTRSGRSITVNLLAAPYVLSATFRIQSVTIRDFTPSLLPVFDVEASSVRFTFEDLLRRIGTRTDPTG